MNAVSAVFDLDSVGSHGMPVVKLLKFEMDAIRVLEIARIISKKVRIVSEFDIVLTQMFDVFFDGDFEVLSQDD